MLSSSTIKSIKPTENHVITVINANNNHAKNLAKCH